jgi:hypothetical protein
MGVRGNYAFFTLGFALQIARDVENSDVSVAKGVISQPLLIGAGFKFTYP